MTPNYYKTYVKACEGVPFEQLTPGILKETIDALRNMSGAFDTPLARRAMPGKFNEECRKSCREVLDKLGY